MRVTIQQTTTPLPPIAPSHHSFLAAHWPLSIAPMMRCTDRIYRMLMRTITRRTLLYTEMISAAAIIHGDRESLLRFDAAERPLVLQIASGDPEEAAHAVTLAESYHYDEYNLNVGCPSERVRGRFGACLMAEPARVASIVAAMRRVTSRPISIKHRLGINGHESYSHLRHFVETSAAAGATRHIVHARMAWLGGLSPKENRTVPPLHYEWVYRLKEDLPTATIEINGEITSLAETLQHLQRSDGVMIGREAYTNPWIFAEADSALFNVAPPSANRREALQQFVDYLIRNEQQGNRLPLHRLLAHLTGFFHGCPGSHLWRKTLHAGIRCHSSLAELILRALHVQEQKCQCL